MYQISFLKINIEVIKETYTWIICHRTTVTNYAGHLKEIRLKTSSTHQTKTALKYMELDLGSIRATLASRVIGKVRTGLHKFCSVAGLASPACKQSFSEYTKYWQQLSKELCTENMKIAIENAKKLVREDE